jgi:hypothetical protein
VTLSIAAPGRTRKNVDHWAKVIPSIGIQPEQPSGVGCNSIIETARVHHASRRRGDRMAARGAVAADGAMLVIGSAPET